MRRKAEKIMDKAHMYYMRKCYKRALLYTNILRIVFACDIPAEVQFSQSAQLVHNGLGCVFHPKTVVGDNCKIYQNVTLGGNGKIINGKPITGAPTLEQNVAIFAGACVLGPIIIGHDSIVGANAVVTKDVPPHSLVVGNPAVIKELTFEYNFE
ncbi:Serine acetyltransferase [Eubacteriaceae bacterium CHKCI004]|nr:Serine acetyltransferase [Eubacteriaceae bacterium CHKCI004]